MSAGTNISSSLKYTCNLINVLQHRFKFFKFKLSLWLSGFAWHRCAPSSSRGVVVTFTWTLDSLETRPPVDVGPVRPVCTWHGHRPPLASPPAA